MDKKSYYAIIPANVRYDKTLKANAKLLYGEITALANEKGFCWSTNSYFADLYDVSKTSISVWISELEKRGYISLKMTYKQGTKQIEQRKIFIADPIKENLHTYIRKLKDPIKENLYTPIKENLKDNIYTNNINNTKENNTLNTAKVKKPSPAKFSDLVENAFAPFLELFKGEKTLPNNQSQKIVWKNTLAWFEKNDYDLREVYLAVKWARKDPFWSANVLSIPALKTARNGIRKIDNLMAKYRIAIKQESKPKAMGYLKGVKEWFLKTNALGNVEVQALLYNGDVINEFLISQNVQFSGNDITEIYNYLKND
tara:strand:+ start:208 stop:1146 length:939 start_codon:yes stop_codon:yes gene_type:complete